MAYTAKFIFHSVEWRCSGTRLPRAIWNMAVKTEKETCDIHMDGHRKTFMQLLERYFYTCRMHFLVGSIAQWTDCWSRPANFPHLCQTAFLLNG